MNIRYISRGLVAIVPFLAATGYAAPPATSAYVTDLKSEYVQDSTSDGIASLNMVLCIYGSMGAGAMVNQGPYIALIDINKCDNQKSSNAAAGVTNYATAVLDVTRTSNDDPMIAKAWLSMTDGSDPVDIFIHVSATQSPSPTQPYGLFRLDYLGKKEGQIGFNGYVDSQQNAISQFETGPNSDNTAMALTATSTTSGSGTIGQVGGGSSNFAYDASLFRRSDGNDDQCFDRAKDHAQRSVWQYGTYDSETGARVDLDHPGFPITATYADASYYGFANYWGVNFQGLDLNALPDGQPIAGLSVADQRPGNTDTYTLSKVGGKLTRWTQQSATLDSLDQLPISIGADLTGLTDSSSVSGFQNWQLRWNSATQNFSVIGTQQCNQNGCVINSINPAATLDAGAFANQPMAGYADAYGGSINIPPTGSAHVSADSVYYYTQATVTPGSADLALYCLSQCPTAASLAAFQSGNSQSTPYGNSTGQQWFSASAANTAAYTFGASGLVESTGGGALVLEHAAQYPDGSMYAQNGINTGRLFTAPLTHDNCPSMFTGDTVCEPASPSVYYTWVTGSQQWQQSFWMSHGSTVVVLDPPQNLPYTVPSGDEFGTYAGRSILLQFNGFGNLYGIPGFCVDPSTNAQVECNGPNVRYVPLFSIPDGATIPRPGSASPLVIKSLSAELRLKNLGPSSTTACAAMPFSPVPLPSGGTHDMTDSADAFFLGTKPTVTAAPKVIDGAVQP